MRIIIICKNYESSDTSQAMLYPIAQLPFREAHGMAGLCVALAEKQGIPVSELSHKDFQSVR